ncbi:hypothetical protein [Bacillus sp. JCM 19034]|uniref:hypothetical protein n=1 Tax=Bacillus sp. JCM 19034 TaxID=1481928 RepID=UPI000781D351|nr:hypothetical protein [Bacillus sp. JCM 19034]
MYVNGYYPHIKPHGHHQPFGYQHNRQQHSYNGVNSSYWREQLISGDATWTNGGAVTKCGLPWTMNQSMTVAVSEQSRFRCGEKLRIRIEIHIEKLR